MSFLRPAAQQLVTVYHDPGSWNEPMGVYKAMARLDIKELGTNVVVNFSIPLPDLTTKMIITMNNIEIWRCETKPGERSTFIVRPQDFHVCADSKKCFPPQLTHAFVEEQWHGKQKPPTPVPILTEDGEEFDEENH